MTDYVNQGFYFTRYNDIVRCAFCGLEVKMGSFTSERTIKQYHQKTMPTCPVNSVVSNNKNACKEDLNKARFKELEDFASRIETYKNFPESLKRLTPELAKAGLFYNGNSDHTVCFYCGAAQKNWNENSDPLSKHLEEQPNCAFLKKVSQIKE